MDEVAARELYEKHAGALWLRFERYYKYVFSFSGVVDVLLVNVQTNGDPNDIYRMEVDDEAFLAPEKLEWLMADYPHGQISNLDTDEQWAWGR